MPGVATHIAIADMIIGNLDSSLSKEQMIKDIISQNSSYYKMGSLGPDMLFFAPDFSQDIHEILNQMIDFYEDVIEPIEEFHDTYIEPITDFVDDVVDTVDDTLFCGLMQTVGDQCDATMNRIGQLRNNLLQLGTSRSVELFDLMQPGIQKGEKEEDWYWFDMLHYRKTGTYAQNMWNNAQTQEEKAYVLGYLTHIAADVTGHPYVNTAVGGPARSHNQRHHFVENMMDTWVYDKMKNQRFTASNIHRDLPHGNKFDEGELRALLRNADEIPSDLEGIFKMMNKSLKDTFENDIHPTRLDTEYLTAKDFNFAYLAMVASLKSVSSSYIGKPASPTEDMLDSINEAMEEFLDHASNPPSNSASNSGFCNPFTEDCDFSFDTLRDFVESVWENIVYLGELIVWVGQLLKDIWNMIACAVTAPIKVVIKSLFWIIQSALYNISQEIKQVLVLTALIPPEKEWLDANPIGQACVKLKARPEEDKEGYPKRAQESNNGFLSYPKTLVEREKTIAGPYKDGATPKDFIVNAHHDSALYTAYEEAEDTEETIKIENQTHYETIGSTLDIAKKLMLGLVSDEDMPNWNLDADRGFAYKTWDIIAPNGTNPLAWNSHITVKNKYI